MSHNSAFASEVKTREAVQSPLVSDRLQECYSFKGGALLGWLYDEARQRGHGCHEMASNLGVTYSYIHQLRSERRQVAHISDKFATDCARYLGVPSIVVKLLAGRITVADFLPPEQSEHAVLDRAFRQMLADPTARELLPDDPYTLGREARKSMVMMYSACMGRAIGSSSDLPTILEHLRSASLVHEANLGRFSRNEA